jgi:trimethylamine--corrinoid protein Co-methyltransferase
MRATEIWQKILAEFEPPNIDLAKREALASYVAKRKEELGSAEPTLEPVEID